jgi:RNA recognition motif-containing protein
MKGYGYVEFSTVEGAQEAINNLNETPVDGRNIRLDFAGARPSGNEGGNGGGFRGGRGGFRGGTRSLQHLFIDY